MKEIETPKTGPADALLLAFVRQSQLNSTLPSTSQVFAK